MLFAFSDCLNSHHIVKTFYYLIAVQIFYKFGSHLSSHTVTNIVFSAA